MDNFILLLIFAFFSTIFITRIFAAIAPGYGLMQKPTCRSLHFEVTPHGGGVGMVLVATILGFWVLWGEKNLIFQMCLAFFTSVLGFFDDIRDITATIRLTVEAILIGILVIQQGTMPSLGPLEGPLLSTFLILAGLWWVNLFNFMDGIDGVASIQSIFMIGTTSAILTWLVPEVRSLPIILIMLLLISTISGFLIFNLPPAKIFMGDTGSLWLGFVIYLIALNTIQAGWLSYQAWLILGAIFISDTTLTLCCRLVQGEPFYEGHRTHAYQILTNWYFSKLSNVQNVSIRRARSHNLVIFTFLAVSIFWLAPLTCIALFWPSISWETVFLAYFPITIFVLKMRSGVTRRV